MAANQFITLVEHDFDGRIDDVTYLVARSNVVAAYDSSCECKQTGKWLDCTTVSFKNPVAVRNSQPVRSIDVAQPYAIISKLIRGDEQ